MYRCNTFEIDIYIDRQWHQLKISAPYLQKEILHIALVMLCKNPEDPKDPDTIDPMWADLLGGLSILEIVIQHPMSFYCTNGYLPGAGLINDAEWNILLKRRLEVIKRLVPEGIEIMVKAIKTTGKAGCLENLHVRFGVGARVKSRAYTTRIRPIPNSPRCHRPNDTAARLA